MEKIAFSEMERIFGGISQEEYCDILSQLIDANWGTWDEHQRKSAAKRIREELLIY